MEKTGRNDPCPCGSGKKFKKCCALAQIPESVEAGKVASAHRLDEDLVNEMLRWAKRRHGSDWFEDVSEAYFDGPFDPDEVDEEVQLLVPWGLYQYKKEEEEPSVAADFLAERGRRLSDEGRAWIAAQLQAWLSVWEVQAVEPGESVTVRDLLTHEERVVHEVSGSKTLAHRDTVLARVVDYGGTSLFCGMHPRPLPPMAADGLVSGIKRMFRVRTAGIDPAKLQQVDTQLRLISLWHAGVDELDRPKPFPKLCNTDGDPLLLTKDHFDFEPAKRSEVVAALAALEGANGPFEEDDGEVEVGFSKEGNAQHSGWANTSIGHARVSAGRLTLETNSTKRADDLRKRAEKVLGPLVQHRARDHSDPEALVKKAQRSGKKEREEIVSPEATAAVRDFRQKLMDGWVDDRIPALDGLTPREAVAKPSMRKRLDVLIRDLENHEARLPPAERYDFKRVRDALGL
jgi:hypothetical protein